MLQQPLCTYCLSSIDNFDGYHFGSIPTVILYNFVIFAFCFFFLLSNKYSSFILEIGAFLENKVLNKSFKKKENPSANQLYDVQ